jgi:hypothetical protein
MKTVQMQYEATINFVIEIVDSNKMKIAIKLGSLSVYSRVIIGHVNIKYLYNQLELMGIPDAMILIEESISEYLSHEMRSELLRIKFDMIKAQIS